MMMKGFGKGGWGFPFGGKGFGKGKERRREGPGLTRTNISETPVMGTVLEWKDRYGWIKLTESVDHPSAAKHEGKVYVHKQDLVGIEALDAGATVQFVLFTDASGLGAEQCSQLAQNSM